jgi:hypothetical protein
LGDAGTEGVGAEVVFALQQGKAFPGYDQVLIVLYVTERTIAGMGVEIRRGKNLPFNGATMTPAPVRC